MQEHGSTNGRHNENLLGKMLKLRLVGGETRESWCINADKAETAAQQDDIKILYSITPLLSGRRVNTSKPVHRSNIYGTFLSKISDQLD